MRDMDDEFVVRILVSSQPFQAKLGDVVAKCGDLAEDIIFISKGAISIVKYDGYKPVISGFANQSHYFGDFEYFRPTVRIADYIAVRSSSLLSFSHSSFHQAIHENSDSGAKFAAGNNEKCSFTLALYSC